MSSIVSIREKVVLAAGASLLAVLCACATAPAPQPSPGPETAVISELQVGKEGGATIVSLLGLAEPVYTAFQQDEPARLVVDLAQVGPGSISEATAVYDGTVEEISVTPFEDAAGYRSTRVEISLGVVVGYDVVALEDRLEIRIVPEGELALAAASDDPWTGSTDALDEETGPEATALLEVKANTDGDRVVIELLADGRIANPSQFVLEEPLRLVLDLPGLVSKVAQAGLEVEASEVSRVRVGQHAEKVRVVLDGGEESSGFGAAELVPTATGLVVAIGSTEIAMPDAPLAEERMETAAVEPVIEDAGEALAEEAGEALAEDVGEELAEDAAEELAEDAGEDPAEDPVELAAQDAGEMDATEPSAETAPALRVYGVQFDAQENGDRVVILSDAPADYQLAQPDDDTLEQRSESRRRSRDRSLW
jgi:hypothetical protein